MKFILNLSLLASCIVALEVRIFIGTRTGGNCLNQVRNANSPSGWDVVFSKYNATEFDKICPKWNYGNNNFLWGYSDPDSPSVCLQANATNSSLVNCDSIDNINPVNDLPENKWVLDSGKLFNMKFGYFIFSTTRRLLPQTSSSNFNPLVYNYFSVANSTDSFPRIKILASSIESNELCLTGSTNLQLQSTADLVSGCLEFIYDAKNQLVLGNMCLEFIPTSVEPIRGLSRVRLSSCTLVRDPTGTDSVSNTYTRRRWFLGNGTLNLVPSSFITVGNQDILQAGTDGTITTLAAITKINSHPASASNPVKLLPIVFNVDSRLVNVTIETVNLESASQPIVIVGHDQLAASV